MDLLEIMTQIEANNKRRLEEWRAKAYMDHRLSELMAVAVNDPTKLPKVEEAYPFVKEEHADQKMETEEAEWKKDQALFMQQARRIKQFNADKAGGGVKSES